MLSSGMDVGLVLVQLLVSAGTGLIVAGTILALGGMGVLRTFSLRLARTEDEVERLTGRFERKAKTEASIAGVARRTTDRELKDEAAQMLAQRNRAPAATERPRVVGE